MNYIKFIGIILTLFSTQANSNVSWSGNIYKVIYQYKKLHAQFSADVCSPGTDKKYFDLLKEYRGQGNYMPEINGELDRNSIKVNLHHYQKKIVHINTIYQDLIKEGKFADFAKTIEQIDSSIKNLLTFKKNYNLEIFEKKRKQIKLLSSNEISKLKSQFDTLLTQIPFMKSYNFPNNHLNNRSLYDRYKSKEGLRNKKLANRTFFYRKIVEDGAYDADHTRSDLYLRSTLDTLYLELQKEKAFLSENVRHDLVWTLKNLNFLLNRGYDVQVERISEWLDRTKSTYEFYKDIIKLKNVEKSKKLIKEKNDSSIKMREFVYAKQAEVYRYWLNKDPLMKALYVLETILFNEVGTVDGKHGLERIDVANVVLNRINDPFYSKLDEKQILVEYLKISKEKYQNEKWLNVLFRVGEFSFTYHYISSVSKIFCPDMSRRGRSLREKNLKISLKSLKERDESFKGVRYFSRVSMLGKIDMSSVWSNFNKIPERPGLLATKQNILERYFLADSYQYLYSFNDPEGVSYQVIEIKDKKYSMTWIKGRPRFFYYRNPHLFTYFSEASR